VFESIIYLLFNDISSIFCENPSKYQFLIKLSLLLFRESPQSQGQKNSNSKNNDLTQVLFKYLSLVFISNIIFRLN
jgi:hypothetical protein